MKWLCRILGHKLEKVEMRDGMKFVRCSRCGVTL